MNSIIIILYVVISAILLAAGYFLQKFKTDKKIQTAETKAEKLIKNAVAKSKEIEEKTREKLEQLRKSQKKEFIEETRAQKRHLDRWEKELERKDEEQKKTGSFLSQKEKNLMSREKAVQEQKEEILLKRKKYTDLVEITNKRLETISRLTKDEARNIILEEVKKDSENKAIQIENEIISESTKKAKRTAQRIITEAIQRCAIDNVSESTVSVVSIPSENMKGRIIGREGRKR
ncbi:MAG: Rnase Y domain-containing protein, partial [candidate division WOR-3 bacterium]